MRTIESSRRKPVGRRLAGLGRRRARRTHRKPTRVRRREADPTADGDRSEPADSPLFPAKTVLLEGRSWGRLREGRTSCRPSTSCDRYEISRTPVSRALSELAEGSDPPAPATRDVREPALASPAARWARDPRRRPRGRPRARMIRDARRKRGGRRRHRLATDAPPALTHAVAEGQAPDLQCSIPSTRRVRGRGFLYALDDLDELSARSTKSTFSTRWSTQPPRPTFGTRFADVAGPLVPTPTSRRSDANRPPPGPSCALSHVRSSGWTPAPDRHARRVAGGETTAYCLISFLASNGARCSRATG